jgi:RNA polymerase sigma-70 factor, ECF subfamily
VARRADRIEPGHDALPWLYGIATNLLRAHRRAEVRPVGCSNGPAHGGFGVVDGHETRTAEGVDAAASSRRIAASLARLRRVQRDVLLLYAIVELSYAEIAQALGIPLARCG